MTEVVQHNILEQESMEPSMFSVTGAQLYGIALSQWIMRQQEQLLYDGGTDFDTAHDVAQARHNQIVEGILTGNSAAAIKAIGDNDTSKEAQDLTRSLSENSQFSLDEVIMERRYDADFLRTLPPSIPRHTEAPKQEGDYVVPGLGTSVHVIPDLNIVQVPTRPLSDMPDWLEKVDLPLDKQSFEWVDRDAIYGEKSEAFRSQLEVFGALARVTDTVYTHVTGEQNLAGILTSEAFGTTALRGADAAANDYQGLNVEKARLGAAGDYTYALGQMDADERRLKAPIKNVQGRSSFVSSYYAAPGSTAPIILFDTSLPDNRQTIPNPGGIGIIGKTQLNDPSLIGIWVPPTFRENLLHWISGWPEEERTHIFKDRPPETVLISTPDQLPAKYAPAV